MDIATETLDRIETHLNYAPKGAGGFSRNPVPIYDGRPVADRMTLDRQGFVLRRHETAVSTASPTADTATRSSNTSRAKAAGR